jgi:AbrB family looped-hinge helix DNA binding protein
VHRPLPPTRCTSERQRLIPPRERGICLPLHRKNHGPLTLLELFHEIARTSTESRQVDGGSRRVAHRPRPAFGLASQSKVRDNRHVRNRQQSKETLIQHSTVTRKGQTTIPGKIRKALRINPGDTLEYVVEGDHATIRVNPGARSLKGVLASKKGKGMSFTQIREAAASAARNREGSR